MREQNNIRSIIAQGLVKELFERFDRAPPDLKDAYEDSLERENLFLLDVGYDILYERNYRRGANVVSFRGVQMTHLRRTSEHNYHGLELTYDSSLGRYYKMEVKPETDADVLRDMKEFSAYLQRECQMTLISEDDDIYVLQFPDFLTGIES